AVVHVVFRLSAVYEYAKDNSGPLKSGVQTVEVTVRTVIGPVYDKFHGVPDDLLYFVDRKVDEFITDVDGHVPLLIKQAFRSSASRG
ncbi:hypothetical protein, partial [Klebsiella pneumoniae]|uniref:hypothetical protein n=1 Tax=Klebsiella pneumoniae TaxID=573 RepID=UPI003013B355